MSQNSKEDQSILEQENNIGDINQIIEEKIKKENGEIQIKKYIKGKKLLDGEFDLKYYEFICQESKNKFMAKIIPKNFEIKYLKNIQKEIKLLKTLNNPDIIKFYNYFEDNENYYLLYEICENGTLYNLLKRRKKLTELEVQYYVIKIINALKYLHSQKIIHRNIKPHSIYFTRNMEMRLGNFDLAANINFDGKRRRKTLCGSPNYIAPEVLKRMENGYSYEVDIWSLGVLFYTLIIGKAPFETKTISNIYNKILRNEYTFPKNAIISEAAKDLINKILVNEPTKRLTLEQILAHDFFNQGYSIPKSLPNYTWDIPPDIEFIRKYMPNADKNGIIKDK